jgi:hypothetical protein
MANQNQWDKVALMCEAAEGIAFDTCHKIYVLLDDAQMAQMKEYGKIRDWYAESCMLRFVSAVRTVKGDPNDGFIDLIPQGADSEDDELN